MSFFEELRRRNVFRAGVAYLAAVWVLIQVTDVVLPNLGAPPWIIQVLIFSCAFGFPVVLVLAWFYEWTADGFKAEVEAEAAQTVKGRGLDFAIIGLLVLAVGFLVVDNYLLERQADLLPNSVAVLPFENLSPDPDDAFFAAGIHEEILNQLAKLKDLSVISRTSVLRYTESQLSIPEIAQELNVETIMEGSVRYANGRVRISTQLIDAITDQHLWSETYDREFADVFAVESDIAVNIAGALAAEFSLAEQARVQRGLTESPAAHALYLRAITAGNREVRDSYINQAIELDPNFALAYADRAARRTFDLAGVGIGSAPNEALELERLIYEDAERALSIDPELGLAHATLAAVHQANWRGVAAEQAFARAVELGPNDLELLELYARFKRYRGERDEAIQIHQRAVALAPNLLTPITQLGISYFSFGEWDAAISTFREVLDREPTAAGVRLFLGYAEASNGNSAEAVSLLALSEERGRSTVYRLAQIAHAYRLAGRLDEARMFFAEFEERAAEEGVGDAWWAIAQIAVDNYEQALERIEAAVKNRVSVDQTALTNLAQNPWLDPELESPEFRALLEGLWGDQ